MLCCCGCGKHVRNYKYAKRKFLKYHHLKLMIGRKNVSNRPEVKEKIRLSKLGKSRPDVGKRNKTKKNRAKVRKSNLGRKISWGNKISKTMIDKKLNLGRNNPNWQGGVANQDYPWYFNIILKKFIRNRDNYICQNCKITEEEYIRKFGQVLHIHHIDYNKENCDESNLITICNKCNSIANGNRDYWYAFYMYIMENIICQ